MRLLVLSTLSLLALTASLSCSDDTSSTGGGANGTGGAGAGAGVGGSGAANTGGTGTGAAGTGGTGAIGTGGAGSLTCQGKTYACGDGIDNDNDGLIDMQDPECLGPCDNTEDSLFGGIPGQPGPPCKVDCYFDQDSGAGNDDCHWSHVCDPHEVANDYYPEPSLGSQCAYAGPDQIIPPTGKTCSELNAAQSQACHDYCGPLTPNGCDCFGCCELPAGSGSFIWLGSEGLDGNTVCNLSTIGDPTLCHPCQPVADCLNDCKPCEICLGKPDPDPGCDGSGGAGTGGSGTGGGTSTGQCPAGVQPCGLPNQSPCPADYFCNTGCCYAVPQ